MYSVDSYFRISIQQSLRSRLDSVKGTVSGQAWAQSDGWSLDFCFARSLGGSECAFCLYFFPEALPEEREEEGRSSGGVRPGEDSNECSVSSDLGGRVDDELNIPRHEARGLRCCRRCRVTFDHPISSPPRERGLYCSAVRPSPPRPSVNATHSTWLLSPEGRRYGRQCC